MKNTRTSVKRNGTEPQTAAEENFVEVLYQRMGDRWFAFSLIDDEVFVGSITQSELEETESNRIVSDKLIFNS